MMEARWARFLQNGSRKMLGGTCNAHCCGGRHAVLDYLFGADPADAWTASGQRTRRRAAPRRQRTIPPPACSAGPDSKPSQPSGGLTVTAGQRGDRRHLRSSATHEAVVEAPHPPSVSHSNNGDSHSAHQAPPAIAALVDAVTQHAALSSSEWLPEDFELGVGEVSTVHRAGLDSPADVFRCAGCSLPACQVHACCSCQTLASKLRRLPAVRICT